MGIILSFYLPISVPADIIHCHTLKIRHVSSTTVIVIYCM